MRKALTYIFILISSYGFSWCGYDEGYDGMYFYNLFRQTNISAIEYYPFLRDDYSAFFNPGYYGSNQENRDPNGNVKLWKEILTNWNTENIEKAVYSFKSFDWSGKTSNIEERVRLYLEFAQLCSDAFRYRNNIYSWDYEQIIKQENVDTKNLLSIGNSLLAAEKNQQLKSRYYYQIIRILHYSKNWEEAIKFFEAKVENKLPKNEIYYYIVDQVAGCYYSTENYDKAAYLFAKVLNNSRDKKMTAYKSFYFCSNKGAQGRSFFKGVEDEKDLLFINSLSNFSDAIKHINEFIDFDGNDPRVELLFMRALNNVERDVWPKEIGGGNKTLPYLKENRSYQGLLSIANQQTKDGKVKNKDFWRMANSYLSFINGNIENAKIELDRVKGFPDQKKELSIVFEVFSWNNISAKNEDFISKVLIDYPKQKEESLSMQNDLRNIILDKVAHTYYKNGQLAKAFLVHNELEEVNSINSLELLDALEVFYNKRNKTNFEELLIAKKFEKNDFMDYVNYQKGIYYLYDRNPKLALVHFNKNKSHKEEMPIPNTIFSNNIMECFECDVKKVMTDDVYKADVFSFIKTSFSRKELTDYLLELEKLTSNEKQWIAKLANYLLANYYFNISNTGYYRGILVHYGNCCDYNYITYANDEYSNKTVGAEVIEDKSGYNLNNLGFLEKHYYGLSGTAGRYYSKVIELSTDKELNARCSYMLAKCELNKYYNEGGNDTYLVPVNKNYNRERPNSKGFKMLKEDYSDTEFHKMIIKECSYFRDYSAAH